MFQINMKTIIRACIFTLLIFQLCVNFTSAHVCPVEERAPPETGLLVNCSGLGLSAIPNDFPRENVTLLDMSNNKLGRLKNGTFTGFNNLRNMSLSGNDVVGYSEGAFEGLDNLEQLDLSLNWMEEMLYPLCQDMPLLNNLSVFYAVLSNSVADDVFSDCTELRTIYLVNSGLQDIRQIFSNLSKLESLYLSDTQTLTIQDPNAFENNPKLTVLDLRGMASINGNRYDKLPSAITQIETLKTLRISKSAFTTFTKDDTRFFDQLTKLYATDNPFTCDCSTTDLITWMQDAENIVDKDTWSCRANCANCPPDSYLMKDYNVKTCDGVVNVTGSIVVLVVIAVLACAAVAAVVVGVVVTKRRKMACFAVRSYARM